MAAINQLRALDGFVSDFLNKETYGLVLSDKNYQENLDRMYETSEKTIRDSIEEYVQDLILKEDCDMAIDDFQHNLNQVQWLMESLSAKSESVRLSISGNESDSAIDKIQISFCEKLVIFLKDLIARVEDWKEGALSAQEANENNFFSPLRVEEERLPLIYHNLLRKGWIVKNKTSLNNFIYYFTGRGFSPQDPIRWTSTEPILTLFLENMTTDEKRWAKAALIFEKKKRNTRDYHPVSREQLSVSRNKVLENDNLKWLLREIMNDVIDDDFIRFFMTMIKL